MVRGKILVCDAVVTPVAFASLNGAVGVVMQDHTSWHLIGSFPLPASHLNPLDGNQLKLYMSSTMYVTSTYMHSIQICLMISRFIFQLWTLFTNSFNLLIDAEIPPPPF